jgi:hypothetical protein
MQSSHAVKRRASIDAVAVGPSTRPFVPTLRGNIALVAGVACNFVVARVIFGLSGNLKIVLRGLVT